MDQATIAIIAGVLGVFVAAPLLTFSFIVMIRKLKTDVEKLRYKKEILELEVDKEEIRLKTIEAENLKYDRLLESKIDETGAK